MRVRKHKHEQTNKQDKITENYELCMFHVRAFRDIYTDVVNQEISNDKICLIIHKPLKTSLVV
jgi:hypothetical protein